MTLKINSIYRKHKEDRICQGDVLRDFEFNMLVSEEDETNGKKVKITDITLPYIVVLTQDCDLEWDFKNHENSEESQDKFLHSILICPAYPAEKVREGSHLDGVTMERINANRWNLVKKNQIPRYHFLETDDPRSIGDLVIDFKHYYAIHRDTLYQRFKDQYIGTINTLFRESVSQRFAYYLSRIGLPAIKRRRSK